MLCIVARRGMQEVYISIRCYANHLSRCAQFFYSFFKIFLELVRRIMLTIQDTANYVNFVLKMYSDPKGLKRIARGFF